MKSVRKIQSVTIALAICLIPMSSAAEIIIVEMKGNVSSRESVLGPEFSVGDEIKFSYKFDSETLDTQTSDAGGEFFAEENAFYPAAIISASLVIGDYKLSVIGSGNIIIRDGAFGDDLYGVLIEAPPSSGTRPGSLFDGNPVSGREPFAIVITLRDIDETVFSSDELVISLPRLSFFEEMSFELGFAESLDFGRAFGTARVFGTIISVNFAPERTVDPEPSSVPEPPSLPIVAFGAFCILSLRRIISRV